MPTRVLLVRHAATVTSREDLYSGATDVELSDEGREQSRALAERLGGEEIHAAYTSDKRRATETAAIIARPHGLTPTADPALREIHHGRWEGKTRKQIEEEFGDEYARWEENPFLVAPVGGETGLAVLARAAPALAGIVSRHADQTVLIVSHKATIRILLSSLLGFDPRGYRDRLDQQPACLNILEFKDSSRARLMLFNDVSHYVEGSPRLGPRLSKWWK